MFIAFVVGEVEQEDEPHQVDVLRRMLYTAARTGVAQFAQMVFSTSAGRVVFETYKKTPPLPEDIAEANGHNDLAAYFHGITERYLNKFGLLLMYTGVFTPHCILMDTCSGFRMQI